MKTRKANLTSLEELIESNYGKRGSKKRNAFETGYENFKLGALVHAMRLAKRSAKAINHPD